MSYYSEYNKNRRKKFPWSVSYESAKRRCRTKYFGRVKFNMTFGDFAFLWFRDKAWLLRRPSIDRIDTSGGYILNNCRFIELSENLKKPRIPNSEETKSKISRLRKKYWKLNKGITRCHVWTKHFSYHLYTYRGKNYKFCVRCGSSMEINPNRRN